MERAAEASGAAQAAAVRDRAALITARKLVPLPPDPLPDKLYAVIDGTSVPMTSKETAGRPGKGEDGRARTREVKLAVFFTQDTLRQDGYPVRDPGSASHIASFEPAAVFAGLFHAREHLHDLARLLEFMLGDRKDAWLAARMEDLDYGYIDGITTAARQFPLADVKKNELDTALGYFQNNAPCMRYHWFRQCGLFTGSGVVEAGCKSVIGQHLKLSGMHWSLDGADAITTLRCQQASRPQDQIWPTARNQILAA